jgi:hypothetical protein
MGSFRQLKEKHLKQGEKFQILKMLLAIIFLYLDYLQKFLNRFPKDLQKQN